MSRPQNVVVVGGGIMGLSVALELAARGDRVLVLEKAVVGAEASSAAAGMLAPQLEAHGPGPMLTLGLRSRELYPAWVRRIETLSKVETGYRECGLVRHGDVEKLRAIAQWQRALGLRAEVIDGQLHLPDDHQVDPPRLMRALSVAATRSGVAFRQGHVHGVVPHGVDVDSERLCADAVVVAAGTWSSLVQGARVSSRVLQPVRGQMIELHLRAPPFEATVADDHTYLLSRGDGRVVCGSTVERVGFDKRVTAEGVAALLRRALTLCPQLANAELHSTWAGLRPWTEDELPILGPGPLPGLHLATGHYRNGILLAPITGLLVAQTLHEETPALDMNPFRFSRFPS